MYSIHLWLAFVSHLALICFAILELFVSVKIKKLLLFFPYKF